MKQSTGLLNALQILVDAGGSIEWKRLKVHQGTLNSLKKKGLISYSCPSENAPVYSITEEGRKLLAG